MTELSPRSRRARQARRALDRRFEKLPPLSSLAVPPAGWIRAIRESLDMSGADLGRRLGVTGQAIVELERSEKQGQIRMDSLRRAADGLDCDLVYLFVPRQGLEQTVRHQVQDIVRAHSEAVHHSMDLEDQGVERLDADTLDDAQAQILNSRRLWKTKP